MCLQVVNIKAFSGVGEYAMPLLVNQNLNPDLIGGDPTADDIVKYSAFNAHGLKHVCTIDTSCIDLPLNVGLHARVQRRQIVCVASCKWMRIVGYGINYERQRDA